MAVFLLRNLLAFADQHKHFLNTYDTKVKQNSNSIFGTDAQQLLPQYMIPKTFGHHTFLLLLSVNLIWLLFELISVKLASNLSRHHVGKPTICICENKDADQL